jgi:hypothetical protein
LKEKQFQNKIVKLYSQLEIEESSINFEKINKKQIRNSKLQRYDMEIDKVEKLKKSFEEQILGKVEEMF